MGESMTRFFGNLIQGELRAGIFALVAMFLPFASVFGQTPTKDLTQHQSSEIPQAETSGNQPTKTRKLDFEKKGGIVYRKIGEEEIKCDVYLPEGRGPFPAILAVHGGAWRHGTKFTLLRHAWKMAQAGYVVVAINYRHAPKHPFPAQIHDCKHAIRWMKANANKYKINRDKIGAFGYSAGGHLVSLLGTSDKGDGLEGDIEVGHEKYSSRVKAVAAGGAPCEFSWIGENSNVLAYWLGGSPKNKPDVFRAASPISYVTPDDPPFFLFHGDSDIVVPLSTSETFQAVLKGKGVACEHCTDKGSGHLATFSDLQWMEKAIEFFDEHIKSED